MISVQPADMSFVGGIVVPLSDEMEIDTSTRRATVSPTLDGLASVHDGGYSDSGREFTVPVPINTQDDLAIANNLLRAGRVTVSVWHGVYDGIVNEIDSDGNTAELKIQIIKKVSE